MLSFKNIVGRQLQLCWIILRCVILMLFNFKSKSICMHLRTIYLQCVFDVQTFLYIMLPTFLYIWLPSLWLSNDYLMGYERVTMQSCRRNAKWHSSIFTLVCRALLIALNYVEESHYKELNSLLLFKTPFYVCKLFHHCSNILLCSNIFKDVQRLTCFHRWHERIGMRLTGSTNQR